MKVEIPKLVKHKVDALSKEKVQTFVTALNELPLSMKTLYMLLLTTGMRRGECVGLQWRHISMENRLISVEQNVTYTVQDGVTVGLPKTSTGIRMIPLTETVTALLQIYRTEMEQAGTDIMKRVVVQRTMWVPAVSSSKPCSSISALMLSLMVSASSAASLISCSRALEHLS